MRTWILRTALICAGVAIGFTLTSTAAFGDALIDVGKVVQRTKGVVDKTSDSVSTVAKSARKASANRKSNTDKASTSNKPSQRSDRPRAQRKAVRSTDRGVRQRVHRAERVGHRATQRVVRSERAVHREIKRFHRATPSDQSMNRSADKSVKRSSSKSIKRSLEKSTRQPAQTADRASVASLTQRRAAAPLTTITTQADAVLGEVGAPGIATPVTKPVAGLIATSGGGLEHLAAPVLDDTAVLLAPATPVVDLVQSVLPDRIDVPVLPLMPELPGMPDIPQVPTPPAPGAASGLGLLPVGAGPALMSPAAAQRTTSAAQVPAPASAVDRSPSAATQPSPALQTASFDDAAQTFVGAVAASTRGLLSAVGAAVSGTDGSAAGRALGLGTVLVLAAGGALGASGTVSSGANGLSIAAVTALLFGGIRLRGGQVDLSALRIAAWRRPARPGFAPD